MSIMRPGMHAKTNSIMCIASEQSPKRSRHPRYVDQPHRSYKGLSILYRDSMEIYVDTTQA